MAVVGYLDAEPSGLAAMLGGLIEQNLADHPDRAGLLKPAVVGIIADDAGVSVTLRFAPGRVHVADGLATDAELLVRTSSEDLIALSSVPLRFGLPDVTTPQGREVSRKLLNGKLKVRGMVRHLPTLVRLQRLLSVGSDER